jgi:drug/metabolite transporter (DMT)-like permease
LIGNFCAIASSAIFAIYSVQSKILIERRRLPISFYFTLLCVFVIIISYAMGKAVGEELELGSFDSKVVVFGLFSSK